MSEHSKNTEPNDIPFATDALTVEGALAWARRVVDDQSELLGLLDELDKHEVQQLVGRLMQVIGLLELKPAKMDAAHFVRRVIGLGYDYAFDPWATSAGEAGATA
ncbi:MAG TPA: hypothetical protein PJ998_10040 [Terrimesophilobacter sp.]|nr:hypothetical protein [Terrimesophilobacter sp.]